MSKFKKVQQFAALHQRGAPFVLPNPWDVGSARILEAQGFKALATTSSGFALTLGRKDHGVTREESLAHAQAIVDAVDIPVSADLENGFGPRPEDVAETIEGAVAIGLAGASIEDSTGETASPIHEEEAAVERIQAAVQAARRADTGLVLTARAEAFLYGPADLDDVIRRLVRFADAGADVLYAPGLPTMEAVVAVCAATEKPVNVLVRGTLAKASVADFAAAGVARLSLGGSLAWTVYGGLIEAAQSIQQSGRFDGLKMSKALAGSVSDPLV